MPKIVIDNREVEVEDGATVLDAAKKLGIKIPTMCFLKGYKAFTSCMVCVVKIAGSNGLAPACGTVAEDGMRVENDCDEVRRARAAALELLLSDHAGDCMGPCQVGCPAKMNIPLMIRQIAAGSLEDAIVTVKKDIALPAILGRICPGPCEKVCRRTGHDEAVSICLLKRYVADADLESGSPYMPVCAAGKNKTVAIVGAGPAGLAAGYYLLQGGFACTIFDEHEKPGGMLRYGVSRDELSEDVLDKEIELILKLGAKFKGGVKIGGDVSMKQLRRDFDAVFVATGAAGIAEAEGFGLEKGKIGVKVKAGTYETNMRGVFAGGDIVRKRKLGVRAVADGKEAAVAIGQFLSGENVTGPVKVFNTRIGRLDEDEIKAFADCANDAGRVKVQGRAGLSDEQASAEAERCMHCDCRKADNCRLRQYAQEYGARAGRYKGRRRKFIQQLQHPDVIYESGKCISCGLCVQIACAAGERLGLTFVGRGFDVRVAAPFDNSIAEGLAGTAVKCVEACPTGALAFKQSIAK